MSGGGSSVPQAYTPQWSAGADQALQQSIQSAQPYAAALPGQVVPQLQQLAQNATNNPNTAGFLQGAQNSGNYLTGSVAPMQQQGASQLQGLGNMTVGALQQLYQTSFDPQQTLYNQQYGQNLDSTNAINAMNGVAGSPYAAGLTNQSVQNFNTGWQNQQLSRQLSGLQGIASGASSAQSDFSGASGLGADAANAMYTGGQQPYAAYNQVQNDQFSALSNLISGTQGALQPSEDIASTLSQYLGIGQAATGINQNARTIQNQESNSFWSGLGQLVGTGTTLAAKAFL